MRHNQNRRPRGRNRKGPNPLTRSYESNGPDVKVRGTASHVAEKYMMLARDALSSGDPVSAENYHQHAEHYNRIVAAAQQAQFQQAQQAQQAQQRDGPDDGRGDERPAINSGSNQVNDQHDDRPQGVADSAASSTNDVKDAVPAQQGPAQQGPAQQRHEATGGNDNKAERPRQPRQPRRPRTEAGDDGSAGKSSAEPKTAAPGDGDSDPAATETPKPNGRRRKPAAEKTAASSAEDAVVTEAEGDTTQDGTAALAAFPD